MSEEKSNTQRTNNNIPFTLVKQTSLGKEKISYNGFQKTLHVVVKNQPFLIQMKLETQKVRERVELPKLGVDVQLLYDLDSLKQVAYVKDKPVECKAHRGGEHGDLLTVEVKVKVLSSQLEDSNFRIKIIAINTNTKEAVDEAWFVVSEPLKVVSKPDQVRKKANKKLNGNKEGAGTGTGSGSEHNNNNNNNNNSILHPNSLLSSSSSSQKLTKSERKEAINKSLAHIEAVCLQQQQLIAKLLVQAKQHTSFVGTALTTPSPSPSPSLSPSPSNHLQIQSPQQNKLNQIGEKHKEKEEQEEPGQEGGQERRGKKRGLTAMESFQVAFQEFLKSEEEVEESERAHKIRKVVRQQTRQDNQTLADFIQIASLCIYEEEFNRNQGGERQPNQERPAGEFGEFGEATTSGLSCLCGDRCNYKHDLNQVFNDDFLFS